MNKNLAVVILSAGRGTRMKSVIPKVLHKICGRPLLDFVLDNVRSLGLKDINVVVGYGKEQVKEHLDKGTRVFEQKRLLGTADALKPVLGKLHNFSGSLLVLYGDNPLLCKASIANLIKKHHAANADCTLLTAVVNNPFGYGRIIRDNYSRIRNIKEELDANALEKQIKEVNVGAYCFNLKLLPKALSQIKAENKKKEYYLTDIVAILAQLGASLESSEVCSGDEVLGINTREDLAAAAKIILRRLLRELMLSGVTVVDPENTYIEPGVKIGPDTTIHPFTFIEKKVTIGSNCSIGPFCHIRPGVVVKDNVSLGNFLEVSRTKVEKGARAKHFGFLGDAHIGEKANIGAGVVTANYDGVNKNLTQIGKEAFIGSDTVLVAPVNIGNKAMTGAGSVVTRKHHVPDRTLVMGVPAKPYKKKACLPAGREVR
ncbi:MAG: bifunctional UDP-N-acetylglucosamine diphosphorylase/glucosamine-1-phosphate N-acetyltransferase GlmU [Candidatus Omnitrophota bacterium]